MEIPLVKEVPGLAKIGTMGPFVVSVFSGATNVPTLNALEEVQDRVVAEFSQYAALSVIRSAPLQGVPADVKEKSEYIRKKYDGHLLATALVVQVSGLGGVIVRTFLAGYSLSSPSKSPMKTFREIPDAAAWLRGLPHMVPSVKEMDGLAEAVERFCEGVT